MDKRLECIRKMAKHASGHDLMRLFVLTYFFIVFVDHIAETAAPLYDVLKGTALTKNRKRGQWLVIADWN